MKSNHGLTSVIFFFIFIGSIISQSTDDYYSCLFIDGDNEMAGAYDIDIEKNGYYIAGYVRTQGGSAASAPYHLKNHNTHNNIFAKKNNLNSTWSQYNAIHAIGDHLFSAGFAGMNGQRNMHLSRNSNGIPWWSRIIETGDNETPNAIHIEYKNIYSEQVYVAGTTEFGFGNNAISNMFFMKASMANSNQSPMVLNIDHISNYNHSLNTNDGSECNDMVYNNHDKKTYLLAGNSNNLASIVQVDKTNGSIENRFTLYNNIFEQSNYNGVALIDHYRGIAVGDAGNNLLITIFDLNSLTPTHNYIIDANHKNLSEIVATDVKVQGNLVFISGYHSPGGSQRKGVFLSFKVTEFSSNFPPNLLAKHETSNNISGDDRFEALDVGPKKVYLTGSRIMSNGTGRKILLTESDYFGNSCCLEERNFSLISKNMEYERNMQIFEKNASVITQGSPENKFERETICYEYNPIKPQDLSDRSVEEVHTKRLIISPNPNRGEMKLNISPEEIEAIVVYGLNGQKIFSENNIVSDKLNLAFLEKGLYVLVCQLKKGESLREKVIILD